MDCLKQTALRVQSQFSLKLHRILWEFHEFSMFREITEYSRFVANLFNSCLPSWTWTSWLAFFLHLVQKRTVLFFLQTWHPSTFLSPNQKCQRELKALNPPRKKNHLNLSLSAAGSPGKAHCCLHAGTLMPVLSKAARCQVSLNEYFMPHLQLLIKTNGPLACHFPC